MMRLEVTDLGSRGEREEVCDWEPDVHKQKQKKNKQRIQREMLFPSMAGDWRVKETEGSALCCYNMIDYAAHILSMAGLLS